jgi:chaperone LolA
MNKNPIITTTTLFISVLFNTLLFSQTNPMAVDDIIKKMGQAESKITDLKIKFVQTIDFMTIADKQKIEAELMYKKPDKIYFKQTFPQEQLIVSENNKLWLYNPASDEVYTGTFEKNWSGIQYFIPGVFNPTGKTDQLSKNYKIELSSVEPNSYVVLLTPISTDIMFKFFLWIDKKTYLPQKSRFISEAVYCKTEITSFETNLNLDNKLFKFKIPKTAKIVKFD